MKKIFKIFGAVILCLLLLAIILPFALQGKIDGIIKSEGNKMLNAKFDYKSLDISFFKHFPNLSITLNGLTIQGTGEFEKDTLINAGNVTAAVNIASLLGDSGYEITTVTLEEIYVNAIKLENGKVNWDIMKPSPEIEKQPEAAKETAPKEEAKAPSPLKILLKSIQLKNINAIYDDRMSKMYAEVKTLDATCSGDLGASKTALDLDAAIKSVTFKANGATLLNKAAISTKIGLDADLVNNKFTLTKSDVKLNAIQLKIDGWVALLKNGTDIDIKASTNNISFKEILSLIPAGYVKDLEKIQTTGQVSLTASAKGLMEGDKLPAFDLSLNVKDAMFKYPTLPASLDKINIDLKVNNPGGVLDKTTASVSPLSFSLAGNTFDVNATVKTPISDPDFNASAIGIINLAKIKDVYPLDNISLTGIVDADIKVAGKLSYVEKKLYEKFNVTGKLRLADMNVKLKDIPEIFIKKSLFTFTPKYLNLSDTSVNIGKNDISAECKFENYLAYALKGDTIKGSLIINSNYFNINDFMKNEPKEAKQPQGQPTDKTPAPATNTPEKPKTEVAEMSVIEIPKNIDFVMDTNMKKVLFGKMTFGNIKGKVIVKNGNLDMENLSFETMGGSISLNGLYSTADDLKSPKADATLKIKNVSFAQVFNDLDLVKQVAPIFSKINGTFSTDLSIKTRLDEHMSPILKTINGNGLLIANDMVVRDVKILNDMADILKKDQLRQLSTKDVKISFAIKDGRITTKPFDIKSGDINIQLAGSTGLDQTIDYTGKIMLPSSAAQKTKITSLDLKIGGVFTSPKVTIDTQSMLNQAIDNAKEKINEELKKRGVDLENAMKKKDELVNEAKKQADRIVQEAEKQINSLVEKAGKNPIQKFAAEKTGEALLNEAKKQANEILKKAEETGNKLVEKFK